MNDQLVEVCTVGGQIVMGSQMERDAARLNEGDQIVIDGQLETVDYTWFYEGVIVKLKSGRSLKPALGEIFQRVTSGESTATNQNSVDSKQRS